MKPRDSEPAPVIDRASANLALLARVSGILYSCGALLVLVATALPHPDSLIVAPLYAVAAGALFIGTMLYRFSRRVPAWAIHACLALACVLIALCTYFSGVSAGVFSVMYVWVVIVAACIATRRQLVLHTAWLLFTYGITLVALRDSAGAFAPVTSFVLTGFALSAAGAAVSWLVESRKDAEAGLRREIETREELQRELEHLANHDPLTGVGNRRRLEEHLHGVLAEAKVSGRPLCLIALDLDGFKRFNDMHGHAAGDRLLKAAASAWDGLLRSEDLITRMGGDEFMIVLPNCSMEVTSQIAGRLRDAVPDGQQASTGIARWNGKDTADEFLAAADRALYETKTSGTSKPAGIEAPPNLI